MSKLENRREKYCPSCEEVRPMDEFYNDRTRPDKKHGYCKLCCIEKSSERYHRKTEGLVRRRPRLAVKEKPRKTVKEAIIAELNRNGWNPNIVKGYLRTLERQTPIEFKSCKKYDITEDDMRDLVWAAAKSCNATPDGVFSHSKADENVTARAFICMELYDRGVSTYMIGKLLNRQKHHVRAAIKNVVNWLETDRAIQFDFQQFQKLIS
jgi:hypothetical protein